MEEARSPLPTAGSPTVYEGVDYAKVYNYLFYRRSNPDIEAVFGDDAPQYLAHFVHNGMAEGRNSHPVFNVQRYKERLHSALGEDLKPYYLYYLEHGAETAPQLKMAVAPEQMDTLHKAQDCNRILLRELDRVCQKYGLRYYMICGTLLGAVRHGSFIPWDDDADVAMTRHDFDILKKMAPQEWSNGDFKFVDYCDLDPKHHAFLDFMSRLVYCKEDVPIITFRKLGDRCRPDIQNHIPLDIYVLDNASDVEWQHNLQTLALQVLYGLGMGHRPKMNKQEYTDRPAQMQFGISALIAVGKILPLRLIFAVYERVRRMFNHRETENYIMSNGFIFCLPWKFRKEWFGEGDRLAVDEDRFMVPRDWDAYLRRQYGDYSRLPAVEDRHPTHTHGATGIYHTVNYGKGDEYMV